MSEISLEAWDRVLAVNVRAVFLLCKLVLPDMAGAGQGTIVNVSSVAGRQGWANAAAYCASKFAVTGFTQALAAEACAHGVRACVIYPGAEGHQLGVWSPSDRAARTSEPGSARQALPPETVADLIACVATAPPELVSTRRSSRRLTTSSAWRSAGRQA